jgi:hypothetical protein
MGARLHLKMGMSEQRELLEGFLYYVAIDEMKIIRLDN